MCYEFEREYWLQRAEEERKAKLRQEERRKQPKPAAPASAPQAGEKEREPVPA
jgi:hypothetical protein